MQSEMNRPLSGTETVAPARKNGSPQGITEKRSMENEAIAQQRKDWTSILQQSLQMEHRVNLDARKNEIPFEESAAYQALKVQLDTIRTPLKPKPPAVPPEPFYLEPRVSLGQKLLFRKKGILRAAEEAHEKKMDAWRILAEKIEQNHAQQLILHEERVAKAEADRQVIREEMLRAATGYEEERIRHNEAVDMLRINYRGRKPSAVEEFLATGLQQGKAPEPFIQHFNLEYHRENHLLFLSVELPHPDRLPRQKELVSDSGGKQQRVVTEYSPAERSEIYNEACYQYILKVLHEVRALDEDDVVEAIKLQAWVNHLNRGNGHMERLCIATLYVSAADIEKINLAQVDPALCFRYLRGVSAPSLADLLPVPAQFAIAEKDPEKPGMEAPLEPQDDAHNLASMQWADLEERLTDLFCREFGQLEGGLEILHSSPEQGLDAIGTDPDLLRGGKILFLARRSNKPLTVSIVRELFGLTVHEGAIKGILVTSSDFTPEAYAFAQHKPITLVNGNSLLSLFEKYGQRYRINLREAVSLASLLR